MALDLHLEADSRLNLALLRRILEGFAGAEVQPQADGLWAALPSGMHIESSAAGTDQQLYAEDRRGCEFAVALRAYLRIQGPEHPEHSAMEELRRLAWHISEQCDSCFILSFQYESTLYWRDADGLHEA